MATIKGQIKRSVRVLRRSDDQGVIPTSVFAYCKGVVLMTSVKGAWFFSGTLASGIFIKRLGPNLWSPPACIGMTSVGFGLQFGGQKADIIIILNDDSAVRAFESRGQLKLGGDFALSAGPVGRTGQASMGVSGGGFSGMFYYSMAQGLFAGISLEGTVLANRGPDNKKFYQNKEAHLKDIVNNRIQVPREQENLVRAMHIALTNVAEGRPVQYNIQALLEEEGAWMESTADDNDDMDGPIDFETLKHQKPVGHNTKDDDDLVQARRRASTSSNAPSQTAKIPPPPPKKQYSDDVTTRPTTPQSTKNIKPLNRQQSSGREVFVAAYSTQTPAPRASQASSTSAYQSSASNAQTTSSFGTAPGWGGVDVNTDTSSQVPYNTMRSSTGPLPVAAVPASAQYHAVGQSAATPAQYNVGPAPYNVGPSPSSARAHAPTRAPPVSSSSMSPSPAPAPVNFPYNNVGPSAAVPYPTPLPQYQMAPASGPVPPGPAPIQYNNFGPMGAPIAAVPPNVRPMGAPIAAAAPNIGPMGAPIAAVPPNIGPMGAPIAAPAPAPAPSTSQATPVIPARPGASKAAAAAAPPPPANNLVTSPPMQTTSLVPGSGTVNAYLNRDHIVDETTPHNLVCAHRGDPCTIIDGTLSTGLPAPYQDYVLVRMPNGRTGKISKFCLALNH